MPTPINPGPAGRGITDTALWNGERPRCAPPRTLQHALTGRSVDYPVYVLDEVNFERAEQAIALCMAHGLLGPGKAI